MKVLEISACDKDTMSGGGMATSRNYECLKNIFGEQNVDYINLPKNDTTTFLGKIANNLSLFFKTQDYASIMDCVAADINSYGLIFLDSSMLSFNIKLLRQKGYQGKIVVFFHNCEYDLNKSSKMNKFTLMNFQRATYRNESLALRMADACVFINERDLERVKDLYQITPRLSFVCRMTMKDKFISEYTDKPQESHDLPVYTMLGSYFAPNVNGIKWFIKEVLPYVKIKLQIVGRNMGRLRNEIDCSNIEIYENVPDLTPYLLSADYMLFPIFEGSGMKVKTCEAMMYAKNIVGTPEAFSGYDVDYSKIGACCTTAEDFISAINHLRMPRFNNYSRKVYLDNYSFESSIDIYRNIFKQIKLI